MQTKAIRSLLNSPRKLENIPQVPVNRAKVGQNHDVRDVWSRLLFQSQNRSGATFRPEKLETERCDRFTCVHFSVQTKAIRS